MRTTLRKHRSVVPTAAKGAGNSVGEIEKAGKVQARLLQCRAPRLASLEYAGCVVPALGVGGDFYDFLDLGPGRVGLVLGDVCGKGISAALMMAALQAALRSHCSAGITEIPSLLRSVNRLFYESTAPQHFATLFVAQYDEAMSSILYANCGHNAPVIVREEGEVERLPATATVIGWCAHLECAVNEVRLWPGDTLVLFSDGVTEAINSEGAQFGETRLCELLSAHRHLSAGSLVERLMASVFAFTCGAQQDDVAIVVARPGVPLMDAQGWESHCGIAADRAAQ